MMSTLRTIAQRNLLLSTLGLAALAAAGLEMFGTLETIWAVHGPQMTLEIDTERDITVNGIKFDDQAGRSVSTGDLNHDGVTDLVIGARQADPGGRGNAGETYVVFGPLASGTVELSTDAAVVVKGAASGDLSGTSVSTGDVNHDGFADLIIGAPNANPVGRIEAGETYVFFGPLSASVIDLATVSPDIVIYGRDSDEFSGSGVASGDINDDGYADVIIGARRANPPGRPTAGRTYVLFGPLTAPVIDLNAVSPDITVNGINSDDLSGAGVSSGDINGDGAADLVIGAPSADPGGKDRSGQTYVLFGPLVAPMPITLELSSVASITINGIDPLDASGIGVSTGDINNDGTADLLIGSVGGDPAPTREDAAESYVIFGPLSAAVTPLELSAAADLIVNGIDAIDQAGVDVSSGDINNDGVIDLIIGGYAADPGELTDAGETYVLFGPLGVLNVAIDIKPGSDPNCFNNNGNGVIPVAILGSASFDVTGVDPATVGLEGLPVKVVGTSNKLLAGIEDTNSDGFADLVVKIEDLDGVFSTGDTTATLTGALFDGTGIVGTDTICIVP